MLFRSRGTAPGVDMGFLAPLRGAVAGTEPANVEYVVARLVARLDAVLARLDRNARFGVLQFIKRKGGGGPCRNADDVNLVGDFVRSLEWCVAGMPTDAKCPVAKHTGLYSCELDCSSRGSQCGPGWHCKLLGRRCIILPENIDGSRVD